MDQEYIEISKKYLNCSFWEQTQDCEIHNYGNKLHVQNNQVCLNQMSRGGQRTKPNQREDNTFYKTFSLNSYKNTEEKTVVNY